MGKWFPVVKLYMEAIFLNDHILTLINWFKSEKSSTVVSLCKIINVDIPFKCYDADDVFT